MPRFVVVGLVLLAMVSAALVLLVPRWQVVPGQVVTDPGFATLGIGERAAWHPVGVGRVVPVDGGVRLINADPEAMVGLEQRLLLPTGVRLLRVTATLTLRGVVPGSERQQQPHVLIEGVTGDGRAISDGWFHEIDRSGNAGLVPLRTELWVAPMSGEARLALQLVEAAGELEVRDLVVEAMQRSAIRDWLRNSLIMVWLAIGSAIGLALWLRSDNRLAASLVLGGLAALALMVLLPDDVLRQPMHELLRDVASGRRFQVLKLFVHLGGFATLALASRLALPRWPLWPFVTGWLAAAALLELAELFFGRFDAGDLVDMAVNSAGAGLGLVIASLLLRRQRDRAQPPDLAAWPSASRRP